MIQVLDSPYISTKNRIQCLSNAMSYVYRIIGFTIHHETDYDLYFVMETTNPAATLQTKTTVTKDLE